MTDASTETVHATCIAIDDNGVLLCGPSGSGKSDLALRLIDDGAVLVADDQTHLSAAGDDLMAYPPETLAGLLEVRGVGIVRMSYRETVAVRMVIDLTTVDIPRLPEPSTASFCGIEVRRLALKPFEASTPAKIRVALSDVFEGG